MLFASLCLSAGCLFGAVAPATQSSGCLHQQGEPCSVPSYDVTRVVIDDQLVVLGGFEGLAIQALRRVTAYDPAADQWRQLADLPTAVTHAPAVVAGRDIWLLGGFVGNHPGVATEVVWRFDFDAGTWHLGPPLPHPVAGGAAVLSGSKIHYFGGVLADRNTGSMSHWALDLSSPAQGWQSLNPLPTPRNHLAGVAWQGRIWAIGGQEGHDVPTNNAALVDVFDDATGLWTAGPALPFGRSHIEGATFATPSALYVVGGNGNGPGREPTNDVIALFLGDTEWRSRPSVPHWVAGGAACGIGGELIVTCGNGLLLNARASLQRRPIDAEIPGELRINSGAGEFLGRKPWCADAGADSGTTFTAAANREILGTTDDELYRNQRGAETVLAPGMPRLRYRQAVQRQPYRVRLHFCELWHTEAGQRVFDVSVDGFTHEEDLDLVAAAGVDRALVRTFDVENHSGILEIDLRGSVDVPIVAAIELEPLPSLHMERRCPAQVNSSGAAAVLQLAGSTSVAAGLAEMVTRNVPGGTTGILLQASTPTMTAIGPGTLCVGPMLFRRSVAAAMGNELRFPLHPGGPLGSAPALMAGTRWHFQTWYRDGSSFGFSDALALQFTP